MRQLQRVDGDAIAMKRIFTTGVVRPYDALPLLSEMKLSTITEVRSNDSSEAAQAGMYIIVPPHFDNRCAVIRATAGYYARFKAARVTEHFYVMPSPTVASAEHLYEQARTQGSLPDFIIAIKKEIREPSEAFGPDYPGAPQFDNLQGLPSEKVTCVCGRITLIQFSDRAGSYVGPGDWKMRNGDPPDTHLPLGWYCGRDGHYALQSESMPNPPAEFSEFKLGAKTN